MVDHGGSSFKEFPNFPEFARFAGTAPRIRFATTSYFLHYFIIIVIIIIVILLFFRRVWPQKKNTQKTIAEQLFL